MATTFVQKGETITVTAPTGGYTSGIPFVLRSGTSGAIAIPVTDIAAAATGTAIVDGVHELPAESGTGKTFTLGAVLYWVTSTGKLSTTATGNTRAGVCWEAKAAGTTTGKVHIGK